MSPENTDLADVSQTKKPTAVKSVIGEVVLVLVLLLIVVFTLNYFSVIPLSKSFKPLASLPVLNKSGSDNTLLFSEKRKKVIKTVIAQSNPLIVTNTQTGYLYHEIAGGNFKAMGEVKVNVDLTVKLKNPSKLQDVTKASNGLIIDNNLRSSNEKYRFLNLFYNPSAGEWNLLFFNRGKYEYYPLINQEGILSTQFSLTISSDGKKVKVILPSGEEKTIQLPRSLYETTNQMQAKLQVSPDSTIEVTSLSYLY